MFLFWRVGSQRREEKRRKEGEQNREERDGDIKRNIKRNIYEDEQREFLYFFRANKAPVPSIFTNLSLFEHPTFTQR